MFLLLYKKQLTPAAAGSAGAAAVVVVEMTDGTAAGAFRFNFLPVDTLLLLLDAAPPKLNMFLEPARYPG